MNEMKNEINISKPFSMIYEEFKMGLANLINNSDLPMSVMATILENYLNEVNGVARQQYQNDKARYEKALFEQDNKNMTIEKEVEE